MINLCKIPAIALSVKCKGVMSDFHAKFFFDGIFNFVDPRIVKLFDIASINTNEMIVFVEPERPFKLGAIAAEIMFNQ